MVSKFDTPKKILVTRTDRIGDLVLSTPVFSSLRQRFPEAHIACLTFLENKDLVTGNPALSEVLLYDKKGSEKGLWGNLKYACFLKRKHFDTVIHLHATNRMHLLTKLAGIPVRIGWDRRMPGALTEVFPYIKKHGERHEALYNFDLLKPFGISAPEDVSELELKIPIREDAQRSLEERLRQLGVSHERPWIVFNPTASDLSKMWPLAKFGEVIRYCSNQFDVEIFLIGHARDRSHVREVLNTAKVPVVDLTGQLNLAMLTVLLQKSALLISNDSGPVHMAQAVGTNVISIFVRKQAGLSPDRWKPVYSNAEVLIGDGDHVEAERQGRLPSEPLTVETVMRAVRKFGHYLVQPRPVL